MASIRYRLQPTATGDLALTDDDQTIALDRARLYLDVAKGERSVLPGFGLEIGLFHPEVPQAIQDAALQRELVRWCDDRLVVVNGRASLSIG